MCFVQGRLIVLPTKRKYFSLPLFGVYLIFLSFSIIVEILKKNKRMLRYKGGLSVTYILVPSTRNTWMLREKRDICRKRTLGKNPPWAKVSRHRGKVLQGLHIRHASDGSVESNMELALGQRCRYANVINKTHNGNILRCKFNKPREGKLDGFSYFESLKKSKRRLEWGTFFEGSLVSSKKG
jgi:hypothetical protein